MTLVNIKVNAKAFEVASTIMEDFTLDCRITSKNHGHEMIIDIIENKKNAHIFPYLLNYLFKEGFEPWDICNYTQDEDDHCFILDTEDGRTVVRIADCR